MKTLCIIFVLIELSLAVKVKRDANVCNGCHTALDNCIPMPYVNEDEQQAFSDWIECLKPVLDEWKTEVGSLPRLVSDPSALQGTLSKNAQTSRGECFDQALDGEACKTCFTAHQTVGLRMATEGDSCWKQLFPDDYQN